MTEANSIQLPQLPFAQDALEPHISARTIEYHYGKHHKAYVDNLNKLIDGTSLQGKDLEDIIHSAASSPEKAAIFNNAAQVWNHTFYWNCLAKDGGGKPSEDLLSQIESDFDSFDSFIELFKTAAATQFGSGWAWLCWDKAAGCLKLVKTSNAELPLTQKDMHPLLTVDVWEHAYYLDYQNKRPDYLSVFFEKLVNWKFAQQNFAKAIS